jgi:coenzyme F420-reducing hydrogenase alpha subunit
MVHRMDKRLKKMLKLNSKMFNIVDKVTKKYQDSMDKGDYKEAMKAKKVVVNFWKDLGNQYIDQSKAMKKEW